MTLLAIYVYGTACAIVGFVVGYWFARGDRDV